MQVPDYKSSFTTSGGGGGTDNSQSVYELNTKRESAPGWCSW